MTVAAESVGWIAIAVTAAGIVIAAVIALWVGLPRFRLKAKATIDERRQAVRLDVKNKGRAGGSLTEVVLVDENDIEQDVEFAGLDQGRFKATELPADWSGWLIIAANREKGPFKSDVKILMRWGDDRERTLVPKVAKGISYYGDKSNWR